MNCPRCGRAARPEHRFCSHCGADLATGAPAAVEVAPRAPSYLVAGILITLCLCAPLGIVTIVYAAQADARLRAGDVAGAHDASRKARGWAIAGGALGLAVMLIYLTVLVLAPGTLAD